MGPPGRALTRSSAPQGARRHTEGVTAARPFYSCAGPAAANQRPPLRPARGSRSGMGFRVRVRVVFSVRVRVRVKVRVSIKV